MNAYLFFTQAHAHLTNGLALKMLIRKYSRNVFTD